MNHLVSKKYILAFSLSFIHQSKQSKDIQFSHTRQRKAPNPYIGEAQIRE